MAARKWTVEQRQRQREMIQRWKPWEQSTGPKSADGKRVTSQNAWTGGHLIKLRAFIKQLNAALREQKQGVEVVKSNVF